ncbi:MAG: NAD(P)-dependent oxidoreductase [Lentisphaeria bacterium]|nr:NAD(P)-dependent oxidoreductase [Lentisphaeria bacterium]
MDILVTGSAGFICGYLVEELLNNGHHVYGIDNFSKYGKVEKSYDSHPNYHFVEGDVKNAALMNELAVECDQMLCAAAMIGGISYFHEFAYDLLAENERIIAASFDAAIHAKKFGKLQKINILSSSMVYECASTFPSREGDEHKFPPPMSTYGFQKLACEYFAQGAWEQYKLPYTVIRPFNCVGVGEKRALCDNEISSGNIKLAMSHVVPDLVQKIVKGQDPLHILGSGNQIRHYTYGGDLARGIRLCIEKEAAINQDFNLSTPVSTSVIELAEKIWKKIHGDSKTFSYVSDEPFMYDVQKRVPDVTKAEKYLDFKADTSLDAILDEVIPWIVEQIRIGGI